MMSPAETKHERRCDRCRRWPWLIFWGVVVLLLIGVAKQGSSLTPKALKYDAQATAMAIDNAIDQFYTEYDHLPAPTSAVKGKDWNSDSGDAENLISILKALDATANSKQIDFLGDIKDAKTEDGKRLNGLVREDSTIALLDPWGHPYLIRMDGDGDGFVTDPSDPGKRLAKKAIVWSAGKDGDPETWKDNVGSWATDH